MQRLFLWLVTTAAALWVAILVVPGISLTGIAPGALPDIPTLINLLLIVIIFGVVNAIVRPILRALAFPITCLTLGLFTFVINAAMLWLTAFIAQQLDLGFEVDGFLAAVLGAVVFAVVSTLLSLVAGD